MVLEFWFGHSKCHFLGLKDGHFWQKCLFLDHKKWHFGCPNQNSKTTFIVHTFPKNGPYGFDLVNLSLLGAILAIFQFCGFSGLFWPFSLIGKMSTSFHSFSCHSSQNESGMRKWPKNDVLWPEWDWPHPNHLLSFISFRGHPTPRMTLEWEKTSFSCHFRGITKPNFPWSEKCFNFGTMGIKGQTNDT